MIMLCILSGAASANVTVYPLFGNNMVLQRNKTVPVYGIAAVGENVSVTFNGQVKSTTADSLGNWRVDLDAMSTNATGQTLTITGQNVINLTNVVIGDVWLAGGQSNMATTLGGYAQPGDIENANYPAMRRFTVPANTAQDPYVGTMSTVWSVVSPSTAAGMSATAFYFARRLYLNSSGTIPIGVIIISVGGTCIDPYMGPEGCTDIPVLQPLYSQNIMPGGGRSAGSTAWCIPWLLSAPRA